MSSESHTLFRAAVFVVIRDQQGRILLQKRAGTDYLPGYYDLPSGHVESGESFAAAAVRELAEEACLTVSEDDLTLLHVGLNDLDCPYINVMFEASAWSGTPTIGEPHKCSDMGFFDPAALPQKCTLGVRLLEREGFHLQLKTPYVTPLEYEAIMREPFRLTPLK